MFAVHRDSLISNASQVCPIPFWYAKTFTQTDRLVDEACAGDVIDDVIIDLIFLFFFFLCRRLISSLLFAVTSQLMASPS